MRPVDPAIRVGAPAVWRNGEHEARNGVIVEVRRRESDDAVIDIEARESGNNSTRRFTWWDDKNEWRCGAWTLEPGAVLSAHAMDDEQIQKWLTNDERALFSHEMVAPLRSLAVARKALFRTYVVADGLVTGAVEVFAAKHEVKRWFDEAHVATDMAFDTHQRMQDSIAELKEEHDARRKKEADRVERARLKMPAKPR